MPKHPVFVILLCSLIRLSSQEAPLPPDFRQHNLTQYNSSLFNPVLSLDRNNPQSLSVWVRWQWQQVDADPTTIFANYTHMLNHRSAVSAGFLQQNTGLFLQTGAVLNYAYAFELAPDLSLSLGLNLFGFRQELADDRFQQNPDQGLPLFGNETTFVIQAAPGIQLGYRDFSLGFAAENALEYNVTENGRNNGYDQKVYLGSASYSFPVSGSGILENARLRPMVFVKTIPEMDTQYGINTLFATQKLWVQGGYHNFYGVSGGIGGTFFGKFSLGALVEIGTSTDLDGKEPTFEIVTSYQFAKPDLRRKVVGFELDEDEITTVIEKPEKVKKLSRKELKALDLAEENRVQDSVQMMRRQQDSLTLARKIAADEENARIAREEQRRKDSLEAISISEAEKAEIEEVVTPEKGEQYQEAVLSEDIRPGFYLIVNIFSTQRYYNLFMQSLNKKGLDPKSFYRTQKKLNYVYLERYDTMAEARKARDSKFFGKYPDTIWIFRVRHE